MIFLSSLKANITIKFMELLAREQVKSLLAQKCKTMKELAEELGVRLNKNYLPNSLSHKLKRGTITYNEMLLIFDILGFEVIVKDKNA